MILKTEGRKFKHLVLHTHIAVIYLSKYVYIYIYITSNQVQTETKKEKNSFNICISAAERNQVLSSIYMRYHSLYSLLV